MLIFLLGMMGSGKTTLGQKLGASIKVPFIDLDEYIVLKEKRTIAEIFEQDGPEYFREAERQALEAVVKEFDNAVIATGGGTPCFFNNIDFINKSGTSVFLDVPQEEIFKRLIATDLSLRPLLADKTSEELKQFIAITLEQRLLFYKQAQLILSGTGDHLNDLLSMLNHN